MGGCTEGVQRAIADFVCFHCPLVASAEAISLRLTKNPRRKEDYFSVTIVTPLSPSP